MLLNLREYHRPAREAPHRALAYTIELLARPSVRTVPLAGGDTLLAAADPTIEAVVDLQGLGLDAIRPEQTTGTLRIGAMVTRAALADQPAARELCSGILAEAARGWAGSVQRNRATVGGALAVAAANDPLLVALLACGALVTLFGREGTDELPLREFLPRRGELLAAPALITEAVVPRPVGQAGAGLARVARTPADAPIVIAAAHIEREGERCRAVRLALGGVAARPLDVSDAAAALVGHAPTAAAIAEVAGRAAAGLQPPADFRGSAAYRRAMAAVLAGRALRLAWERSA
ncbi:MAG: FAD binding domain-containing protein [Anaerolineae bacterium]